MRSMVLGLAAVLFAAIIGLTTADAQPARKAVPVAEMKKVQAFQGEFNRAVDDLLVRARKAGATKESKLSFVVSTKAIKLGDKRVAVDTKAVIFQEPRAVTMSFRELEALKGRMNSRLGAMMKRGNLTELDRRLLEEATLDGMARKLRR